MSKMLSRKLKVSLMLFYGRFGLPVPHREPIIMAVNSPVFVEQKVESPTQEQIDVLHRRVVQAHKELFNSIKPLVGGVYADKDLVVNF